MATTEKTTKATTARKTAAGKSTTVSRTAKAAAPKAAAKTNVADAPKHAPDPKPEQIYSAPLKPEASPAGLYKMPELMAALEGKSELKRGELRQTVGHVLEALAAALAEGHDVALPGFGKITAKRRETKPGGEQIIARIKIKTAPQGLVRTPTGTEE